MARPRCRAYARTLSLRSARRKSSAASAFVGMRRVAISIAGRDVGPVLKGNHVPS